MIIKKVQTAIFVKNFQIQDEYEKSGILLELKTAAPAFDGQPVLVPIPNDAPQEIPRIILKSADNQYSCNIALNRSDIFFDVLSGYQSVDVFFEAQKNNSFEVFNFLKSKNSKINRIGFVVDLEYKNPKGVELIREKFLVKEKFEDPKELVIGYNKEDSTENKIPMNVLVSINGRVRTDVIKIRLDINSLAEIMYEADFKKENIEEIINFSINKTKHLMETFFI